MSVEEVWNGNEEEFVDYDDNELSTCIRVNGSSVEVEVGSVFAGMVKETAMDAGLGKFRVFLNGSEVKPSEAPDVFEDGMTVELRQYDVAG
jgi:hypothetical protein